MILTRWQTFYQEDPRVLTTGPSACARYAADFFLQHGKHQILDLGCGVGRDTAVLAETGLHGCGIDAAPSGLQLARRLEFHPQAKFHWIQADARRLPFKTAGWEGIYCFGLLHEFAGETGLADIAAVMTEIERLLQPKGLLILAVAAGDPQRGLPHVRLFDEAMFDQLTQSFHCLEKCRYDDLGCTGRPDYTVWRGTFNKKE